MKILIYGSKGWIGSQFISNLQNNCYIEGKSRVNNIIELKKEIEDIKPTHILCLIGRTHGIIDNKTYSTIDYLEEPGKLTENIRDNLFSPITLAILCQKYNIHLTYLGTGCIFEYDNNHLQEEKNGFTIDDLPNFFGSSYSIVKGYTDQLMHLFDNVLNLRIRMPITSQNNPRNFITKITNYEKICSIPNSMTVLPELIPIAIDMMKNNICGTINLTNPGFITHNEILQMYKEIVDPTFTWKNFSIIEQNNILSSKRSNNFLDTTRLEELYPNINNIKNAVKLCLERYPSSFIEKTIKEDNNEEHDAIIPITTISISNPDIFSLKNEDNKTILITGGCGFIASNFINHFFYKYDKIKIINIDALYYCSNENNIDINICNSERYKLIKGNICSKDLIDYILTFYKINYIVHFAAQSHVQNSFEDSILYTKDNILGTHTLLECCREYGLIERFIHVSTDEVYGESKVSYNEKQKTEYSMLCPTNPYAGTKAGAELIAQTYLHSFNMPIIITRGNNVYGPNQYPEKLIPKFIKLLKENNKVTIQGNGSTLRAFMYVSDAVNAFDIILNKGIVGEIYNIGCNEGMEYTILDVAKILIKLIKNTDNYTEWIEYIKDRPFNDARYYISNDKLKDLGWDIKVNFIDGIKLIN